MASFTTTSIQALVCSAAILIQLPANAGSWSAPQPDSLCVLEHGWAWNCQPLPAPPNAKPKKTEVAKPKPMAAPSVTEDPADPIVRLRNLRKEEERARALAVLEPTEENIINLRRNFITPSLEKASLFRDLYERISWTNPEFDYTNKRPVGTLAKREWETERQNTISQVMHSLNSRYGIFFIYDSTASSSAAYAPIVADFAQKWGIQIQAISRDGNQLATWPGDWKSDKGGSFQQRIGVASHPTPLLVLFERPSPKSPKGSAFSIGSGILAHDEIERRIYRLTSVKPGEDF
ncbi:conjugal transfer protein TraF [Aeromonas caviae]|uniref:conjugal transfer protein TraF n=1 Tax=Aeromonas caviae TaxID=648 RepID=UPI0029D5A23A|nr:conjugal transfer protein TraF [Aeromonas caviae]MDX7801045.1 conjugal transfer protein TraF [Aeromonas caviae]